MPRKYPTDAIDRQGGLDVNPLSSTGEYFSSKHNEKIYLKPPNFDSPGVTRESFYIQEKHENNLLTKHLKILREHQKIQLELSLQRTRKLIKDQAELRARFVIVNSFIRDFTEKRKKALRKIELEIEQQKELKEEIELKLKSLEDFKTFAKEFKATVEEYSSYETVLKDAAAKAKCPSIEALMNRCDAMMVGQAEIMQLNAEKIDEIEAMRKKTVDIVRQVTLIYAGLMNELAELTRSYHKAQSESFHWEKILSNANSAVVHQNKRRELARDGINQIYRMLCRRKGDDPEMTRIHVEKSLDFIKDEFKLLQNVLKVHYGDSFEL